MIRTLLRLSFFLFFVMCFSAGPAPAAPQDATALWTQMNEPAMDAGRVALVENIQIQRDRIRITLLNGTIQFVQQPEAMVYGAAFRGSGRIQVDPPDSLEAHQLRVHTDDITLAMEFTEAVFFFTDQTFSELSKQLKWGTGSAGDLAALFKQRLRENEDYEMELLPRLFARLLSGDRPDTALFAADLKTERKGWIHARFDALDPEQVQVGRLAPWSAGYTGFDTWLRFPANDKTSTEAYRNPLARDEYRLKSYKIDSTVTSGAELTSTARVELVPRSTGDRALLFKLDANLRATSVKDAGGAPLTFFQPRDPKDRNQSYGDYIVVVLGKPTEAGAPMVLDFAYSGKRVVRKVGDGNYFCQTSGWYPQRENDFAVRVDFELVFRSPKRFTLVATGDKVSESEEGGNIVTTWRSAIPLAVAGFAFGDYKFHTTKAGNVDVNVYANKRPDDFLRSIEIAASGDAELSRDGPRASLPIGSLSPANLVKTMAEEVANTIRVFERYFGPYPYKTLNVTNLPLSANWGQGWPNLLYLWAISFLDSTQRQQLGITEHVQLKDFFRAHEASHQWWGHRVGWKSYRDQWISEGIAQFSGNLYVQVRQNQGEFLARMRQDKLELKYGDRKNRRFENLGPITMGTRLNSSDTVGAYGTVVYNKGGWVMHMLRMMMFNPRSQDPDDRFIAMMQDFTRTYHNQPASTEDFKAIVEKHMIPSMDLDGNKKMDWFFRQYVYGTGIPEYNFTYQLQDAGEGKTRIIGTVTQSGVREGWKDALPLYVVSGGRTLRAGMISVTQKVSSIEAVLPIKVDKLLLNYNEDTLAEIKQ